MLKHHCMIKLTSRRFFIINSTDYWLFAHKFCTWNASIAALQFWTEDLDPQTLSSVIERVYTAFFYSDSAQHMQHVEVEVLFSHFVTKLNWCLWTSTQIRRYWIWKWEWKYESCHFITSRTMTILHFHARKFIFWPVTQREWQYPSCSHAVCCWLTYEENDTSSLIMENHLSEDDRLTYHLPSIAKKEMMAWKNTSQQYLLMRYFGWKNLFQRGTYVYMKMPNMIYALIHVHMI